jgi:hypothetical protein
MQPNKHPYVETGIYVSCELTGGEYIQTLFASATLGRRQFQPAPNLVFRLGPAGILMQKSTQSSKSTKSSYSDLLLALPILKGRLALTQQGPMGYYHSRSTNVVDFAKDLGLGQPAIA